MVYFSEINSNHYLSTITNTIKVLVDCSFDTVYSNHEGSCVDLSIIMIIINNNHDNMII